MMNEIKYLSIKNLIIFKLKVNEPQIHDNVKWIGMHNICLKS